MEVKRTILLIAVVAACTFFTRLVPFLLFGGGKETPDYIKFLGKVLPPAIIATLVVYCLRGINFMTGSRGIPELVAVGVTAILHGTKRNILLSVAGGTLCYMLLIQGTIF